MCSLRVDCVASKCLFCLVTNHVEFVVIVVNNVIYYIMYISLSFVYNFVVSFFEGLFYLFMIVYRPIWICSLFNRFVVYIRCCSLSIIGRNYVHNDNCVLIIVAISIICWTSFVLSLCLLLVVVAL